MKNLPEEERKRGTELIRSELNIEKWPLFTTSQFRGKSREYSRQEIVEGKVKTRKVIIGRLADKEIGVLRLLDLKCFYSLIKLWEDAGRPFERNVTFAIHEIAKIVGKSWSGRTYQEIKESLLKLRGMPITWISSFYQKDTDTMEEYIELFNILSDLKIYTRKEGSKPFQAFSTFRFNERLLRNLLNNHSKPLYLDVALSLKKEVSILLYLHLDLVMANKVYYARMTKDLIKELDLGGDYRYLSYRKRVLSPALKELEGVMLSTGILSYARLHKAKRGDWKAVFKKELPALEKAKWEVEALVKDILEVTGDEKSRLFYTKVARLCPSSLIYRCLSEVKDEAHRGLIRTTKGAVFTDKIKRYCKELDIDLGLKGKVSSKK
jgi:hypothetical protein